MVSPTLRESAATIRNFIEEADLSTEIPPVHKFLACQFGEHMKQWVDVEERAKGEFGRIVGDSETLCVFGDAELFRECRKHRARETHWAAFPVVNDLRKVARIAKWSAGPAPADLTGFGRVAMAPMADCPNMPAGFTTPAFTVLVEGARRGFHDAILAAKAIALKDEWRELPNALVWISPQKSDDLDCLEAIASISGNSSSLALATALLSFWSPDPLDPYLGGLLTGSIEFDDDWRTEVLSKIEAKEPVGNLVDKIRIGQVKEVENGDGKKGLKIQAWERWNQNELNRFHRFVIPGQVLVSPA